MYEHALCTIWTHEACWGILHAKGCNLHDHTSFCFADDQRTRSKILGEHRKQCDVKHHAWGHIINFSNRFHNCTNALKTQCLQIQFLETCFLTLAKTSYSEIFFHTNSLYISKGICTYRVYAQLNTLPAQMGVIKTTTKQTTNVSMLLLWRRKADYNFSPDNTHTCSAEYHTYICVVFTIRKNRWKCVSMHSTIHTCNLEQDMHNFMERITLPFPSVTHGKQSTYLKIKG